MSEQLSIPAGGGLLSLNLSVLPQGASLNASGQAGGASGFGSMLGQQTPQGEQAGGFFLPPSGGALPVEGEPLSQNEMMQQQLAHLAQMLEQQQSSPEGELPAQLASELAKALRRYSEEDAVLAEVEGVSQTPVDGDVESPLSVAQVPTSNVSPLAEPIATIPEGEQSSQITALPEEGSDLLAPAVPQTEDGEERPPSVLPLVGENSPVSVGRPENGLPKGVEVSSQHRAEPAGTHPLELRQQAENIQSIARAESQMQAADKAVEVQVVPVVSPAAKDSSSQEKTPSLDVFGRAVNASLPKEGRVDVTASAVTPDEEGADDPLLRRNELFDGKKLPNTPEGILGEKRVVTPVRTAGAEPVINMAENSGKPLGDTSFGTKLESTIDATQQLLQKVAAAERAADSSSTSRAEIGTVSSLSNSTSQSILQPVPAQKVVTEGHTLMMPNQMKMSSPAWNNALGERAIWVAAQSSRVAEIRLDPPELGSLNVRIQINQDQVNLSFTSPHAHVRDAVEQSLPRLREMFAEQGLELQDSSVSDQSQEDQRERFAESGGEQGGYSSGGSSSEAESTETQEQQSIGLVDYYA